jgi:hypothetical protein
MSQLSAGKPEENLLGGLVSRKSGRRLFKGRVVPFVTIGIPINDIRGP